jgi:hypothetical protein
VDRGRRRAAEAAEAEGIGVKLRLGIVCIFAALVLGAVAVTSMHYALAAAAIGVGFALVGVGLLCEATDPRRKPNPRTPMTPSQFARLCEAVGYPRESWAGLYRWYRSEAGWPIDG